MHRLLSACFRIGCVVPGTACSILCTLDTFVWANAHTFYAVFHAVLELMVVRCRQNPVCGTWYKYALVYRVCLRLLSTGTTLPLTCAAVRSSKSSCPCTVFAFVFEVRFLRGFYIAPSVNKLWIAASRGSTLWRISNPLSFWSLNFPTGFAFWPSLLETLQSTTVLVLASSCMSTPYMAFKVRICE